jgi:hypothetical protein
LDNLWGPLGWLAIVVGAIGVGIIIVLAVRRWAAQDEAVTSFTFQDLREMKARGEISEAEFQSMRGALLNQLDIDGNTGGDSLPSILPPDDQADQSPST